MQKHINQALKLRRWVSLGHHFPGRVRLKYKSGILSHLISLKSTSIGPELASIPAFKNYHLNSATGSIVIDYDATVINPDWINALFSGQDAEAKQACYQIARQLDLKGVNDE